VVVPVRAQPLRRPACEVEARGVRWGLKRLEKGEQVHRSERGERSDKAGLTLERLRVGVTARRRYGKAVHTVHAVPHTWREVQVCSWGEAECFAQRGLQGAYLGVPGPHLPQRERVPRLRGGVAEGVAGRA
jgi:hypothetical protein